MLAIGARAGDELLGLGGTLALHAAQGDAVHARCVFAGAAAGTGPDPADLQRSAAALGIDSRCWGLARLREPSQDDIFLLARRLALLIVERRPTTIYAPWHGELDLDCFVASSAAALAVELADFEGSAWGYELRAPLPAARVVDVSAVWAGKCAAFASCAPGSVGERALRAAEGLAVHRSLLLPGEATHAEAFAPLASLRIPVPGPTARAGAPAP